MVVLAFITIFVLLKSSVYIGISVVYPLIIGLGILTFISMGKGFKFKDIIMMILKGGKKSLIIIRIFVLIGAIMSVWMAGGTIGFIVYYGVKFINPNLFILYAFILCSIVSFLLGTSFGTVGTMGITLMVLAKSGNVSIDIAAGAIIAGAYFGDRCSPMSSSANLVAGITGTDLYRNIGNMLRTSIIPYSLSVIIYFFLSQKNPLVFESDRIVSEIQSIFSISPWTVIPAALIMILAIFRVDVKISMLISIFSAIIIGVVYQHRTLFQMLKIALAGFDIGGESFLRDIIRGGGIISMVKISLIVFVSSAYSGIFEGTGLLGDIEALINKSGQRFGSIFTTIVSAVITSCFGATQALAIILTNQLVKKLYDEDDKGKHKLALSLENTAVVIAALIPWNIAGAVPAAALSAGSGYAFYAFYLYLIPLSYILFHDRKGSKIAVKI